jgi:hypothetical protein
MHRKKRPHRPLTSKNGNSPINEEHQLTELLLAAILKIILWCLPGPWM